MHHNACILWFEVWARYVHEASSATGLTCLIGIVHRRRRPSGPCTAISEGTEQRLFCFPFVRKFYLSDVCFVRHQAPLFHLILAFNEHVNLRCLAKAHSSFARVSRVKCLHKNISTLHFMNVVRMLMLFRLKSELCDQSALICGGDSRCAL